MQPVQVGRFLVTCHTLAAVRRGRQLPVFLDDGHTRWNVSLSLSFSISLSHSLFVCQRSTSRIPHILFGSLRRSFRRGKTLVKLLYTLIRLTRRRTERRQLIESFSESDRSGEYRAVICNVRFFFSFYTYADDI